MKGWIENKYHFELDHIEVLRFKRLLGGINHENLDPALKEIFQTWQNMLEGFDAIND